MVHDLTHRQSLLDILAAEPASSGIQHLGALVESSRGERDVGGNHEVTGTDQFYDTVIGAVETRWHLQELDVPGGRCAQILIRHQRYAYADALRGPIQHVLDDNGAGIGASHQTGWTGVIARTLHLFATSTPEQVLENGKAAATIEVRPIARGAPKNVEAPVGSAR